MEFKLEEVVIELTKRCNLSCLHCGSSCENQMSPDELTAIEWQSILEDLKDFGVGKVVFSGGEPTLKSGFTGLMEFCRQIDLRFGFISNGFNFNRDLLNALEVSRPFAVGLSIDGLKKTHNLIRQNDRSWTNALITISRLQDLKIPVCISTTVNRLNYSELSPLAGFLNAAQISAWQIQLAMPVGRMRQNCDLQIDENIFQSVCRQVMAIRKTYPQLMAQAADCFGPAPLGVIRSENWTGCSAGISSIGIDACGYVTPCLSMRENHIFCGRLPNQKIAECWHSQYFDFNRHFHPQIVKGNCVDCDYLKQCRGGCNSQSLSHFGSFHDSPFCFYRQLIKPSKQPMGACYEECAAGS